MLLSNIAHLAQLLMFHLSNKQISASAPGMAFAIPGRWTGGKREVSKSLTRICAATPSELCKITYSVIKIKITSYDIDH